MSLNGWLLNVLHFENVKNRNPKVPIRAILPGMAQTLLPDS